MALTPVQRFRYLIALLASGSSLFAVWAFPEFFRGTPFLASGGAVLIVLLCGGVGPAILTQVVTILGAIYFVVPPTHSFAIANPEDIGRLAVFSAFFIFADVLAWRNDVVRRAARGREGELRESETRYQHVLEQASDGVIIVRRDGKVLLANRRICEMLGYTEKELLGLPMPLLYPPGGTVRQPLGWDELGDKSAVLRERLLRRKDGSTFAAELSVGLTPDGYAQAIVRDITERRQAEEALRAERDLLDGILATSVAGILVVDPDGRVLFLNSRVESVFGLSRSELMGRSDLPPGWRWINLDGSPLAESLRPTRRVVESGEPIQEVRLAVERPDGQRRILSISAAPLRDESRRVTGVVHSLSDITEQYRAQQALGEREEQLQRITSAVPGVVYQYIVGSDGKERFAFVSERARELLGVSAEEILVDPERAWVSMDPADRRSMEAAFERAAVTLEPWSFDFRVHAIGDRPRWVRDMATAVRVRDPDCVMWNGVMVDITDQRRLQEELLQSQKMDSLGRLAGGVAHDFNNLLTVIRGYADVLSGELSDGDPRLGEVREIRKAADRASSLTRQLLAVSRRQLLVPREVDINALVQEMERMLRRVIGEDIIIVTRPGDDLGWVRADPGQLEQVLLNLAVNARDAMPKGGTLTIETHRAIVHAAGDDPATRGVPPGDFVVLQVTDTGLGMEPETQAQIFEPFFTTKPVGEGTGLGLSTVYGIVQQSNGTITVESTPGAGTAFRVFLPRMEERRKIRRESVAAVPAPPPRRRKASILLVEDDDGVRQLTRRVLEQYGFGVHEARNGTEALASLDEAGRRVDAVVSDVVMPGMSGRELVGRLRLRRPELPVLFLSGYTGEEVSEEVRSHPHQGFLQKPFSPDALAAALEELLADGDPSLTSL
ncbi:MAG: PAS domain S-box protein [Gemmatimonadales bacterium]|nr:PAS domain S-box protein [Gemmatimonadales bacterium]